MKNYVEFIKIKKIFLPKTPASKKNLISVNNT